MNSNKVNISHQAVNMKLLLLLVIITGVSCKKEWLDAKPQLALVVPSTISDFQALLDNTTSSTGSSAVGGEVGFNVEQVVLPEVSSGEFYVNDNNFNTQNVFIQNAYTWAQDIFTGINTSSDWNAAYKKIYYSNIILEGIEKINPESNPDKIAWRQVKGSGLFFRAYNHYEIAQTFSKPFDNATASSDLGIPLRIDADINTPSSRASVKQTYDFIIKDLKEAADLLPVTAPTTMLYKLRPTKNAATAMLARVYLAMAMYDSAWSYANKALQQHNALMNYNSDLNPNPYFIPRFNTEVIFHTTMIPTAMLIVSQRIVDSTLYKLYEMTDKRRSSFFFNLAMQLRFVGGYDQNSAFSGLATDEVYLIRAECYARRNQGGDKDAALADLNLLLINRYVTGSFTPVTAADAGSALQKILLERRKELCFRGLRWSDLRRLNREPQFAETLNRRVNSIDYILAANDPKYVLPIPPDVIKLTNMEQNPR